MKEPYNTKQDFHNWFQELEGFSLRSERFYEILSLESKEQQANILVKWLEAAYLQGARDVADETLYTLGCYATAVAGLEEPKYNPSQAYDTAAGSLDQHYDCIGIIDNDN